MLMTAAGAFIGALLSLFISIFIEFQRKPKLYFEIESPPHDATYKNQDPCTARFVRVFLHNKRIGKWLTWVGRDIAMQCSGEIQFHHISDGTRVFSKSMPIRWTGSDEPLTPQILPDGRIGFLFDITKYSAAFRRDIFPDLKEGIDIAARFDDDVDCYGWSNDSYLPGKGWRNPDWRLPRGRYLVTVRVKSSGETTKAAFQLENDVNRDNFRLQPATEDDISKLVRNGLY